MTVWIPLPGIAHPFPLAPSFMKEVLDPDLHLANVVEAIVKAKQIVGPWSAHRPLSTLICLVISGAGISTAAGISDFRSSDGLFQKLKRENPGKISKGQDLFDASMLNVI